MHDLGADGDGGGAGHALELTDDIEVGHAVEPLQKIGEEIGRREAEHVLSDAADGEILFREGPSSVGRMFSCYKER